MHYAILCPRCGSPKIKNWEQDNTDVPYTYEQEEVRIIPEFTCLNCSEIFGCVADNSDSLPQSHCVAFHFSVESNKRNLKSVCFEKADSYTTIEIASPYQGIIKKARVPITEWQNIKDDLFNQLFILSWQSEYKHANEAEWKQWKLILEFDDRESYEVAGHNVYPVLYYMLLGLINPYLEELGFEKESILNDKK